jgi:hypothetical protein
MNNKDGYIPQINRKKILVLSDDLRFLSGIARITREFVLGLSHKYNFVQLGGSAKHPEEGKIVDMSQSVNSSIGISDSYCKIYPITGYGNPEILKQVIAVEKPDTILIFTDPRFWIWLFQIEREIRQIIPITYLNIWDDIPFPMYNHSYYKSCDLLMGISKQTVNINRNVLSKNDWLSIEDLENGIPLNGRTVSSYVPHGVNPEEFKPLDAKTISEKKKKFFEGKNYEFVLFYNNRNITRKRTSNIILGFRTFCDNLPIEDAKKCVLVLHTNAVDDAGTDLRSVKDALCPNYDIVFSENKVNTGELNELYNIADVTISATSNEGWGIGTTESIMSGTPTIMPVTGGQQDQIGQTDDNGGQLEFSGEWGTNSDGKYKNHGVWVKPIYPAVRTLQGSPLTPYIFDDLIKWEDIAEAILYWWKAGPELREKAGLEGRRWGMNEGGLTSQNMCDQMSKSIDITLKHWKPRSKFSLHTSDEFVGNKMFDSSKVGFEIPKINVESVDCDIEKLKSKLAN